MFSISIIFLIINFYDAIETFFSNFGDSKYLNKNTFLLLSFLFLINKKSGIYKIKSIKSASYGVIF